MFLFRPEPRDGRSNVIMAAFTTKGGAAMEVSSLSSASKRKLKRPTKMNSYIGINKSLNGPSTKLKPTEIVSINAVGQPSIDDGVQRHDPREC